MVRDKLCFEHRTWLAVRSRGWGRYSTSGFAFIATATVFLSKRDTRGWVLLSCTLVSCCKYLKWKSLSRVRLFAIPWTTVHQASLSITNSWSLLGCMSIEPAMPSNHLVLCRPLLYASQFLQILGWPKSSFGFSTTSYWRIQKKLFGQPNIFICSFDKGLLSANYIPHAIQVLEIQQ